MPPDIYITSRSFVLPKDRDDMAQSVFYNMWQNKQWPYRELETGARLFWLEGPSNQLVWDSKVNRVERFEYSDKLMCKNKLKTLFSNADFSDYFNKAPYSGHCLAYQVIPIRKIIIKKPDDLRFPQLGWLKIDEKVAKHWGIII